MPSTKDFEKKHSPKKTPPQAHQRPEADEVAEKSAGTGKAKRRPGRDHEQDLSEEAQAAPAPQADVAVVDVNEETGTDEGTASVAEARPEEHHYASAEAAHGESKSDEKIELHFYGSEILRAKFPKAFEVAESVATDWVHDGNFEGLPLGHPLAQYFAAKGLKKVKEVEKKVMDSPVAEKMAMQALQAGMKAQEMIHQIREKVHQKK
jgi:hypothetical protein